MNPAGGNITPRIPWKRLNPLKMIADLSFSREEEQLQPEDEQLGLEMLSKKQFEEKIQTLQSSLPEVQFSCQQDPVVRLQLDDITKGWRTGQDRTQQDRTRQRIVFGECLKTLYLVHFSGDFNILNACYTKRLVTKFTKVILNIFY